MEWHDEGLILSVRPHAETSALAEVFTRGHGRHMGLVMGGRSRRVRPVLQTGNHVEVRWRARVEDHLGHMTVEMREGYAARVLENAQALDALGSLAALTHLLPERDPHPTLFEVTLFVLSFLEDADALPALLVRWELALLDELGFGLELNACAATGSTSDLIYVSPRSGRAVSAQAGAPYKAKLLFLPPFLRGETQNVTPADILAGLKLTGYFLEGRVLAPMASTLPAARSRLIERITAAL